MQQHFIILQKIKLDFYFLVFFCTTTISAQQNATETTGLVKWISLDSAQKLNKIQPKPILIDVYTDWCGWCKHMMKTTFSHPGLANYINAYFYPVRFNAETQDTVEFLDKKYINKNLGTRSPNELAIILLEGKLSYPTIVFFNNNYQFKLIAPGYMSVKDIEPVLIYTVEYIFNTTSLDDFRNYYNKAFYPDSGATNNDTIVWKKSFEDIDKLNKTHPKKTLLFVTTPWCYGCKTMLKSTFNNSSITPYVREHFHTVLIDAQTSDTIVYKQQSFINTTKGGFHPFLKHFLGDRIFLPSMLFFDENLDFISYSTQYMTPEILQIILKYFAENIYKNQSWEDYLKTVKK